MLLSSSWRNATCFRTSLSLAYSFPIRVASFPRSEFITPTEALTSIFSPILKHCRAQVR
uniref:Uncharacterized protein n=1 Tax=Arundo donax TaxID=35708 RepID=A0A0A9HBG8_ARUDO